MTTKTMLFNPYTGTPRHPSDIQSDPEGILIVDPEATTLQAYKAAQPDCRTCEHYTLINGCYSDEHCTNGDKYQPAPKVVLWRTEP